MRGIVFFDDLDARAGTKTIADETVTLRLDGKEVRLDLTTAHAAELRTLMQPYMVAGGAYDDKPTAHAAGQWPERRAYNTAMRDFADREGIRYRSESGSYYYSRELVTRFDAWLEANPQEMAALIREKD